MIRVFFQGGLGNQMFQYAAGRHLAEQHGAELCFDLSWYFNPRNRKFLLPEFGIAAPVEKSFLSCLSFRFLGKTKPELLGKTRVYREKDHVFNPDFLNVSDGSTVIGFFQSEKYFKPIEAIIRDEFSFSHVPASDAVKERGKEIGNFTSVAVHVRRGDYLTLNGYLVCTEQYYRGAIDYMRQHIENPRFYFFSDDLDWCRHTFNVEHAVFCNALEEPASPLDDLRLISACKHHILSNSSFSWWGAWLGSSPDQVVVVPDAWKATGENMDDVYCDGWVRMEKSREKS